MACTGPTARLFPGAHIRRLRHQRRMWRACAVAMLAVAAPVRSVQAPDAPAGLQLDMVFGDYAPLAANAELVRRTATPLDALKIQQALDQSGEQLRAQSLDLSAERFALYVPPREPPGGYALLVFVPPWHDARVPEGWSEVLERLGVIFVSAARSGNDQNVIARREPLALLAAYNVMRRYNVNAQHVYIGGFSGGSRVAMRLAVAYPDLFRGALLNAGADPLKVPGTAVPPQELLHLLQESSRLVYVTGERDAALATDMESRNSMQQWCVFNVSSQITLHTSHEQMSPFALMSALQLLLRPQDPPPAKLSACRAQIEKEVSKALGKVQSLIAAGKPAAAQALLTDSDRRFGGAAAPRSVELQSQITPR